MSDHEKFKLETAQEIHRMSLDADLKAATRTWMDEANRNKYSYHFEWFGRPIIQYPQDVMALQEIIASTQPDLIIETGIAHGGSVIFSSAMLELNALMGGPSDAKVLGIDIDIRAENRRAIESHPLAKRLEMLEGSSTSAEIVSKVEAVAAGRKSVMVILDSNHTHEHVLQELRMYSKFVTAGNYLVVFDTVIEFFPTSSITDRPWSVGDNPWTAVQDFLSESDSFSVCSDIEAKLQVTVAPGGYLRRS